MVDAFRRIAPPERGGRGRLFLQFYFDIAPWCVSAFAGAGVSCAWVTVASKRGNAPAHSLRSAPEHLLLSVCLFERRRRSRDVGAASCFVEDARPGMKLVKAMNDGHDATRRGGFINLQNVLVADLLLI